MPNEYYIASYNEKYFIFNVPGDNTDPNRGWHPILGA